MMAASAHEVSPPWPAIPPLPIQPAPRRALRCLTVADVAAWQARNCQEERGVRGASRERARSCVQCCCAYCYCSLRVCPSASPLCMWSSYGRVLVLPSGQDVSFCPFNACAFASVLVAMAERAMEGVLGAGGAPSAQCLQAPQAPARFLAVSFTPAPSCRILSHLPLCTMRTLD